MTQHCSPGSSGDGCPQCFEDYDNCPCDAAAERGVSARFMVVCFVVWTIVNTVLLVAIRESLS